MANEYDIRRILDVLPHRYPFLLVDRVLDLEQTAYPEALKLLVSQL